ncbi:hypothetical protein ACFE04_018653 [Oxalis oulophora]
MGSLRTENNDDDRFFDAPEDIASVSDSDSDSCQMLDFDNEGGGANAVAGYDLWINHPGSIHERRTNFLNWMGLNSDQTAKENHDNAPCNQLQLETLRLTENSGAVLRSSAHVSCSPTHSHSWSADAQELFEQALAQGFVPRMKSMDNGSRFMADHLKQDSLLRRLRKVKSIDEFERNFGLSPFLNQMRKNVREVSNLGAAKKNAKPNWLRRLRSDPCDSYQIPRTKKQLVRVRSHKKQIKELSGLYMGQDMQAHAGSISTMKFSPDGQYLASAGEDSVVRVWKIVESERSDESDFDIDQSRLYYKMNDRSELVSLHTGKEKNGKLKGLRKTFDSNCVVLPRKLFRISEKPIHEFHGHCGEVLDLSWAKNKILSSSVDKTVRLWEVGCYKCLKVFSHNNYVTCVQFNPVDNNYFISGSIDGKVRIWEINGCQVVDWTDITEIVTAVCFRPHGKGAIVGSITGNCHFYNASDNRLQPCAQVCLQGKKKKPKKIAGLQFSPVDPNILMVTSADSRVRIIRGHEVVCKFRGLQNSSSQLCASFTSDGKRVVSACEDSNVYIWNYANEGKQMSKAKKVLSCEHFLSSSASVAIPWLGFSSSHSISRNISSELQSLSLPKYAEERDYLHLDSGQSSQHQSPFSSPEHFSSRQGFFSESISRGSATWPEEKLPPSSSSIVSSKSHYKYLKTYFQNTLDSSNVWGLAIVTAGWDGRIRSFQNFGLPHRN